MARDRTLASTTLAAAASLLLAACGSSAPTTAAATADPGASTTLATTVSGIAATLEQYREDQITKTIQVQVVNQGARRVQLSEVRLSWPGLTDTPAGPRREFVAPGQVLDLPVPLGDAVCGEPPKADATVPTSAAVATATATWDDGTSEQLRIPVTDTRRVLARVYRPDCQRQSVEWVASVRFDPEWADIELPDGKPAVRGALRLHREHGAEPVTLMAVNGSVLLAIAPADPPAGPALLTLGSKAIDATLSVVVTESGRCEAHALAESKHTFFLPAAVKVGNAPVVLLDVIPDDAAKMQLGRMINRWCGIG